MPADQPGHRGLAGARIADEDQVPGDRRLGQTGLRAQLLHPQHGGLPVDLGLDRGQPGQVVQLGEQLLQRPDRLLRRRRRCDSGAGCRCEGLRPSRRLGRIRCSRDAGRADRPRRQGDPVRDPQLLEQAWIHRQRHRAAGHPRRTRRTRCVRHTRRGGGRREPGSAQLRCSGGRGVAEHGQRRLAEGARRGGQFDQRPGIVAGPGRGGGDQREQTRRRCVAPPPRAARGVEEVLDAATGDGGPRRGRSGGGLGQGRREGRTLDAHVLLGQAGLDPDGDQRRQRLRERQVAGAVRAGHGWPPDPGVPRSRAPPEEA